MQSCFPTARRSADLRTEFDIAKWAQVEMLTGGGTGGTASVGTGGNVKVGVGVAVEIGDGVVVGVGIPVNVNVMEHV